MNPSNPNGANQYVMDPRQKMCWDLYVDPRSDTFGNATQSAIKAGYTDGTANQITTEPWFIGKLRRLNLLNKAEKVLDETLDASVEDETGKRDKTVMGIKLDCAKFVAETQGKKEGYSKRSELTGADGVALPTPILAYAISGNNSDAQDTKVEQKN